MFPPIPFLGMNRLGRSCSRSVPRMVVYILAILLGSKFAVAQTASPECSWPHKAATYDYRIEKRSFAPIENRHFPPQVEALVRGSTTSAIGADIDYMLDKVPNHHRALLSLVRLGERDKTDNIRGTKGSVGCYFERALGFRSDDTTVRLIYATFLSKHAREPEATRQLEMAASDAGDNPFTHYNIGLVYFDMKNYDRALAQAHKAYGLGFGSPNLRDQLMAAGKWAESVAHSPVAIDGKSSDSSAATPSKSD